MFSKNPDLCDDGDDDNEGAGDNTDDLIVRQAEGARVGGRMLCALDRWESRKYQ